MEENKENKQQEEIKEETKTVENKTEEVKDEKKKTENKKERHPTSTSRWVPIFLLVFDA